MSNKRFSTAYVGGIVAFTIVMSHVFYDHLLTGQSFWLRLGVTELAAGLVVVATMFAWHTWIKPFCRKTR